MRKIKYILATILSAFLVMLSIVVGGKVVRAADAVDGTYTVYASSFYNSETSSTGNQNPDKLSDGIFEWTSGTKKMYYQAYGTKAGSNTLTNTLGTWEKEVVLSGTRTLTVTTGTLATGQSATCTVYSYSEHKSFTIAGTQVTDGTWEVMAHTITISTGSLFTINFVTNCVLLQVDVVISTDTSSTYYDVNFFDGENIVHTDSVIEGGKATAFSYAGSRWNYNFDKWLDSNDEEFDFANTTITSETNLYASYVAWGTDVIADSNTLDLSLMTKGYQIFGTGTSISDRVLEGTIYTVLKGNTCYASTNTTVGDLGTSTAAIKTSGNLNNHQNGVSFTVTNAGTLTVWAKNGSDGNRTFGLYKDGNTSTAESSATVSTLAEFTLNISSAGTYELGSTAGSVYFYYISFTPATSAAASVTLESQANSKGDSIRYITTLTGVELADVTSWSVSFTLTGVANAVTTAEFTTLYLAVAGTNGKAAQNGTFYLVYTITEIPTTANEKELTATMTITFADGSTKTTNIALDTIAVTE